MFTFESQSPKTCRKSWYPKIPSNSIEIWKQSKKNLFTSQKQPTTHQISHSHHKNVIKLQLNIPIVYLQKVVWMCHARANTCQLYRVPRCWVSWRSSTIVNVPRPSQRSPIASYGPSSGNASRRSWCAPEWYVRPSTQTSSRGEPSIEFLSISFYFRFYCTLIEGISLN